MSIKKIINRIIKNIHQLEFFSCVAEQAYQDRIKEYANKINRLSAQDVNVVNSLQQNGIAITNLQELQLDNSARLLDCCYALIPPLLSSVPKSKN